MVIQLIKNNVGIIVIATIGLLVTIVETFTGTFFP